MNGFYNVMRRIMLVLMYFLAVFFGLVFLLSFSIIFSDGTQEARAVSIGSTVFFGAVTAYLIWRIRKHRRRETRTDKMIERSLRTRQMGKMLSANCACPACGSRMAVCQKGEPLRLQMVTLSKQVAESEYYCPRCDERRPPQGDYVPFRPEERPIPEEVGKVYRIRPGFLYGFALVQWLAFLALGLLCLRAAFNAVEVARSLEGYPWSVPFFSGLMAFVFLGGAAVGFLQWMRALRTSIAMTDGGIILKELGGRHYYAWSDFRLATRLQRQVLGKDAYAFDLEQRVLMIDSGMQEYHELADLILRSTDVPLADVPRQR